MSNDYPKNNIGLGGLAEAAKQVAAHYPEATWRTDRAGLLDFYNISKQMPCAVLNLTTGLLTICKPGSMYVSTYPDAAAFDDAGEPR